MLLCGECGSTEPDGKKFCGECGARLAEPAPAARERRVVTVLFCDLVGFTTASDGADPEEVQARLTPYHAMCRRVIEGFGGTVEKFIGDAVMAAFGAPTVHEDDPERAVRAGLRLLEAVDALDDELGLDLAVRIGIATGEAVVNLGARPQAGEGMLAGDVVNTAARLQGAAPEGRVLVGATTYEQTRGRIEYDAHDAVTVKGKAEPVDVWLAVRTRGSSGEALSDTSVPMVGREDELAQLQRSFTRSLRESSVQLVTVIAEPGLGKSRLVQAFSDWVEGREDLVTWRQGRCLPYGDAAAFAAFADVVKAQTEILDSDTPDVARAKLSEALALLIDDDEAERAWLEARLAPLVGLPSPESDRDELFAAWRRFLEHMAATRPVVVAVEDLHWADPALLEFLTHVLEWTTGVPLVVVATARPELYDLAPTWAAGHRNATTLSLAPLDADETSRLVASMVGSSVLAPELHAALLRAADGNPLYAREYLGMLADRPASSPDDGAVTEIADQLPGSVHAVIAARLDTLTVESKQLLQCAAVVGHTFWSGAVAAVAGIDEDQARDRLRDLARRGHVRAALRSSIAGAAEYTFAHALIADVAYQQVPRAERADRHRRAAEWYVARITDPDRSADAATVADHYAKAVEFGGETQADGTAAEAAARWHTHAAQYAGQSDPAGAVVQVERALALTAPEHDQQAARLLLHARLLEAVGREAESRAVFARAVESAAATGDVTAGALAQVHLSLAHESGPRSAEADAVRAAAVEALAGEGPSVELAEACVTVAKVSDSARSTEAGRRLLDLARDTLDQLEDPPAALQVQVLAARATNALWAGDPAAESWLREAAAIAEREALTGLSIDVNDTLAIWAFFNRDPATSDEYSQAAIGAARRSGRASQLLYIVGNHLETLAVQGRLREAVDAGGVALAKAEATTDDLRSWRLLWLSLAWVQVLSGDLTAAAHTVGLALASEPDDEDRAPLLLVDVERQRAAGLDWTTSDTTRDLLRLLDGPDHRSLFPQFLARLARVLADLDRLDLVRAVVEVTPRGIAFYDHNVVATEAVLAEREGRVQQALGLHEQAVAAWEHYGYPVEVAHALLGKARCLAALGQAPEPALRAAREALSDTGARPLLDEIERRLAVGA